jgi:hypothetical protein
MARAPKILTDPRHAAQTAEREAQEAAWNAAIDGAIKTLHDAQGKVDAAKAAVIDEEEKAFGTRERIYVQLAKLSNDNQLTAAQINDALSAAILHHYAPKAKDGSLLTVLPTVGSLATLKSELARAMHPKVRAQVPAIIAPWAKAYSSEDAATANTLAERFGRRHHAVTKALQLAIGKEAKLNRAGTKVVEPAVHPVICDTPESVLGWIAANPKSTPEPRPATGVAPVAPKEMSAPDKASWQIGQLIASVTAVSNAYAQPDCLAKVLAALGECTAQKMLANVAKAKPNTPTPVIVPEPAKVLLPAEPVPGAADLDDAIGGNDTTAMMEQFQAFQAFQAMMKANSGK